MNIYDKHLHWKHCMNATQEGELVELSLIYPTVESGARQTGAGQLMSDNPPAGSDVTGEEAPAGKPGVWGHSQCLMSLGPAWTKTTCLTGFKWMFFCCRCSHCWLLEINTQKTLWEKEAQLKANGMKWGNGYKEYRFAIFDKFSVYVAWQRHHAESLQITCFCTWCLMRMSPFSGHWWCWYPET